MPHNAYFIVEEFLRSPDPQSRKNALTALAVMAEEEQCAERLAESALTDADAGVRKRALAEIVSLPESSLERAAWTAWKGLKDESTEQNAYAVLGHLRGLGKPVPKPEGALSQYKRLELAWGLKNHLNPSRDWAFRVRGWKAALVGGVLGVAALLIAFYKMTDWPSETYYVVPILLVMFAVMVGVAATQHATPVNLYYDRRSAFLVEAGAAVAYSLLPVLLLVIFNWVSSSNELLTLILGVPILVGVVRAATFLSYGVAKGRRRNIALQVAAASGIILLLLTAVNFFVWLDNPVRINPETHSEYAYDERAREYLHSDYPMLEAAWMALFPIGIAVALAFAAIDSKLTPVRPVAGRLSKVFSYAVIALSVVLMVVNIWASSGTKYKSANINPTFDWLFGAVPVRQNLPDRLQRPPGAPYN